jgi:hypothetical protein
MGLRFWLCVAAACCVSVGLALLLRLGADEAFLVGLPIGWVASLVGLWWEDR